MIATTRSLISAGTERMLVDFGKARLIDKARFAAALAEVPDAPDEYDGRDGI